MRTRQTIVSLGHDAIHPTCPAVKKRVCPQLSGLGILQCPWYWGWDLLHSEVVSCQASIVDVENQAGIVSCGIKHLDEVYKRTRYFRLQTENRPDPDFATVTQKISTVYVSWVFISVRKVIWLQ